MPDEAIGLAEGHTAALTSRLVVRPGVCLRGFDI